MALSVGDMVAVTMVVVHGASLEFSCFSSESVMWLMKSEHQSSLTGIALGDKPKSRFSNERLANILCMNIE